MCWDYDGKKQDTRKKVQGTRDKEQESRREFITCALILESPAFLKLALDALKKNTICLPGADVSCRKR
jgi:hypothetical protein